MSSSRLASLFSVKHHPRFTITNPSLRRRYQRRRLVLAVLGGILGGLGVGFTLSHGGQIGAGFRTAAVAPVALGVVIAVVFVLVPLPKILRWVATAGAVGACVAFMDMSLQWQIGLAIVGFALSWVVAVLLQFGIGVTRLTAKDFVSSLSGLALVTVGGLATTTAVTIGLAAGASPVSAATAAADEQQPVPCPAEQLQLNINGADAIGTVGEPLIIEIGHDAVETRLLIAATSDLPAGDVSVDLLGVDPFPFVPPQPINIWEGELRPTSTGGTATEPTEIIITRSENSDQLRVSSDAFETEAGLIVGLGHFRATLTPQAGNQPGAQTGGQTGDSATEQCVLDGYLRITAPPLDTLLGRIGVGAAIIGLGLAAGAVAGGSVQETNLGAEMAAPLAAIIGQRVLTPAGRSSGDVQDGATGTTGAGGSGGDGGGGATVAADSGTTYELVLQLQLSEDDKSVYQIKQSGLGSWVSMVHLGVVGSIAGGGPWEIPIQVRTDPKKVTADWASFQLSLVSENANNSPVVYSLTMPANSDQWTVDTFDGDSVEIDLRSPTLGPG